MSKLLLASTAEGTANGNPQIASEKVDDLRLSPEKIAPEQRAWIDSIRNKGEPICRNRNVTEGLKGIQKTILAELERMQATGEVLGARLVCV